MPQQGGSGKLVTRYVAKKSPAGEGGAGG